MKAQTATLIGRANLLVSLVLLLLGMALSFLGEDIAAQTTFGAEELEALFALALLMFPATGALIVSKQPGNPIGWIFCAIGLTWSTSAFSQGYAAHALASEPGSLPFGLAFAWLQSWLFFPGLFIIPTFFCLLFPDGRLLSRRWRPIAWLAGASVVLACLGIWFQPGPLEDMPSVDNPLGASGQFLTTLDIIGASGFFGLLGATAGSIGSLIARFRRATGTERQQIKWIVSAAVLLGLLFASGPLTFLVNVDERIWEGSVLLAFAAVPITAGFAILRYHLYEIDRVINRTVVYGVLTVALALAYFALIVGLQAAFEPVSGGSDFAVALTTLIVAALFLPARQRVQALVDRRFNRRAYDAARTIEAFGARLRQQIDLDTLRYELLAVVDETMQPAKVALWLRPQESP